MRALTTGIWGASSTEMRVLQLLPALKEGGVEKCAVEMSQYLSDEGMDNWVVSAGGPLASDLGSRTHHVTIPVGRKSPFAMIMNARRLARLVRSEKIDVIHALSRAPAWVAWIACRLMLPRSVRFVTTVHGAHGHGNVFKRLYNSGMLRSDRIVASSRFIRDHLMQVYGTDAEKIQLAQRGLDETVFDPTRISQQTRAEIRRGFGISDNTAMLVMIARVTTLKGHAVLIDSLSKVTDLDWHMVFVGTGAPDMLSALQDRCKTAGLEKRISWAGSLRDVTPVLAAADLAFSASIRPEAFGFGTIEAQAMETPVIATAHGGSLETVLAGKTGWLVPPRDAPAMADAIRKALGDMQHLKTIGHEGRLNVLANFTRRQMLQQESAAYSAHPNTHGD